MCNRMHQISEKHNVSFPFKDDFFVDNHSLFKVFGSWKSFYQIADIPNSYLAVDDINTGNGPKIPL
ncbi:MAG: hypothetical protein PHR53_08125 [Bacteroidales bacterium]|nr:hypothetical protein [Bacteroidales bacterium]